VRSLTALRETRPRQFRKLWRQARESFTLTRAHQEEGKEHEWDGDDAVRCFRILLPDLEGDRSRSLIFFRCESFPSFPWFSLSCSFFLLDPNRRLLLLLLVPFHTKLSGKTREVGAILHELVESSCLDDSTIFENDDEIRLRENVECMSDEDTSLVLEDIEDSFVEDMSPDVRIDLVEKPSFNLRSEKNETNGRTADSGSSSRTISAL